MKKETKNIFIDGSLLITEALVKAGADIFVGYPITPSNRFYSYGQKRFPSFYPAPDEISVLQWMSGAAAAGKIPVTATAFPGLALMVESLNMAYAMELPMVIVVTQRLGPSTGSATIGAQGDLGIVNGIISGFPIPTFCPSNFEDCWTLSQKAVETAVKLRTPVILLTSKEMVMTSKSFDFNKLEEIKPLKRDKVEINGEYKSYQAGEDLIAPFIDFNTNKHQVRINSSMHNETGRIVKNEESINISKRLAEKINNNASELASFDYKKEEGSNKLIISYGISSLAALDAVEEIQANNQKVSLLIIKTLIPLSEDIYNIIDSYKEVLFVEENLNGQLKEIIFGKRNTQNITSVNKFGSMIAPSEIVNQFA